MIPFGRRARARGTSPSVYCVTSAEEPAGTFPQFVDVTEARAARDQLRFLAYPRPMTGRNQAGTNWHRGSRASCRSRPRTGINVGVRSSTRMASGRSTTPPGMLWAAMAMRHRWLDRIRSRVPLRRRPGPLRRRRVRFWSPPAIHTVANAGASRRRCIEVVAAPMQVEAHSIVADAGASVWPRCAPGGTPLMALRQADAAPYRASRPAPLFTIRPGRVEDRFLARGPPSRDKF